MQLKALKLAVIGMAAWAGAAFAAAPAIYVAEEGSDTDEIRIVIPPEGPVANAAAYQGATFIGQYTRDGDFMGRVLDTGRLMQQLRPEMEARVRASRLGFEGDLVFSTDTGEATVAIRPDGVQIGAGRDGERLVAELPQETLARLCLGAFEPRDVLARLPEAPDSRLADLLAILFPRREPHIYPLDWF